LVGEIHNFFRFYSQFLQKLHLPYNQIMRLPCSLKNSKGGVTMKRLIVLLAVLAVVATVGLAAAHGPGWGPGARGWGMGPGWMMGVGPGYMMGWGPGACFGPYGYDQKFLEETRDLRKQLHDKRFEYFEALRDPKATPENIEKLEKEIFELQQKLFAKAPRDAYRGFGPGGCWAY
jgi:Spy/CpxP family protein refolding chaperone